MAAKAKQSKPRADDHIELRIRLPRRPRLAVGKKGDVAVDLERIPQEVFDGVDGLLARGLRQLLVAACAGSGPDVTGAEEMVESWYAGFRTRRARGIGRELPTGRDGDVDDRTRRHFEVMRRIAAGMLDDPTAKGWDRRKLVRRLGRERYAEIEGLAKREVGRTG